MIQDREKITLEAERRGIRSISLLILLFLTVAFVQSVSSSFAYELTFQPRITENLTYTDNLFLSSDDDPADPKESDGYSLFTPGFTGAISSRTMGASISYNFGYTRYFEWSSQNSWNHNMNMSGWYALSRHTRIDVSDGLVYTADPLSDRNFAITQPPDSTLPEDYTTRRAREPYLTNYGSVSITHQFGRDDSIVVEYGNGIRHDFGDYSTGPETDQYRSSNYMRHTPRATITYWFNSRWGVELEGTYDQGNFKDQADTKSGTGRIRLNRRFSPHFDIYSEYTYYTISYDEDQEENGTAIFSQNYDTHSPILGLNYSIAQDLSLECHAGAVIQTMDQADTTVTFSGGLSLAKSYQHGSVRVYGSTGQAQGVYTDEAVGPSIYFETGVSGTYQILEDLSCNVYGSFRRDDYGRANNDSMSGDSGGSDDTYGAGIGFNWHPYPWLGFDISYSFRQLVSGRDTGLYDQGYTENRGLLVITLTTPRPWRTIR